MAKLLDKFIRVLPKLQARNIEKRLQRPSEIIKLSSPQEFKEAFQEALIELLESDSMIRIQVLELIPDTDRDSEVLNYMLDLIADDLSALFSETELFLEAKELQEKIYKDEVVGKLRRATLEAEAEIERLELLKGNTSGLKEAIVDKFTSGSNRMPRTDPFAHTAYIDPKFNITTSIEADMPIGLNVGGLVLPSTAEGLIQPSLVRDISTSDSRDALSDRFGLPAAVSASTNGRVQTSGNISNIIDNRTNTFWIKGVATESEILGGAKLNLSIDLGPMPVDINYIQIEPIANFEQELVEVYYVDERSLAFPINIDTAPIKLTEPVRLYFKKLKAKKLVCVFAQKNSTPINVDQSIFHRYVFGFDNIKVGDIKYSSVGYYVSKTLSLPQVNKIVLAAKENSAVGILTGNILSPISNPLPLIEYWAVVRELDNANNLVSLKYLPILPANKVTSREKIEASFNDKAKLNFMIDLDIADDSDDLVLYRDGVKLLRPVDYTFEPPSSPYAEPTVLNIPEGYNYSNEYVAEYAPLHRESNAPIPFTDRSGLVRYNPDNSISLERPEASRAVKTEVNLIIIMRGTGNGIHTSVVDEVVFGIG